MTASVAPRSPQFRGRVVRTLDTAPRSATETFWVDGPREPWEAEPWWDPASVIDERDVEGPEDGPVLLWDEAIGHEPDLAALLESYFSGNVAAWTPPMRTERDTTGLSPVSEDEFWAVIAVLGGKTWEKTINAAARSLAAHNEEFVLRWQETLALKAVALDQAFRGVDEDYAGFPEVLAVLGATIARGPGTYEAVLAEPLSFNPKWLNDAAGSALFVGAFALDRRLGGNVTVTTSFTPIHTRMLQAWQAEMDEREAHRQRLSANPDSVRSKSFHAARALVREAGGVHLRVVVAEVQPSHEDHRPDLLAALESFGGRVCSPVETHEGGWSGLPNGPVLEVKRRFTGTRDEYLKRYVRAEH